MSEANDHLLTFIHITDTHISPDPRYNAAGVSHTPLFGAKALVKRLNELPFKADFVLHTGDVCYDPDPLAYEAARAIFAELKIPIYYLNGNHDDKEALQRVLVGREPLPRFDQEFEVNGVQIVCIDSQHTSAEVIGQVTAEQLQRLAAIAEAADPRPLIVATHHNVLPVGIPWLDEHMGMVNGVDFHRALLPAAHRLRGVFHGHVHQATQTYRDGIVYTSGLSSWYQLQALPGQRETVDDRTALPGFNVVTVTPTQTFIRTNTYVVEIDIEG